MRHRRFVELPTGNSQMMTYSPEFLAAHLGDLRYDGLADYLAALAEKLQRDSESDGGRGRGNLATCLLAASADLRRAVESIEDAWDICRPYMKED